MLSALRRHPAIVAVVGAGALLRLLVWVAYKPALIFVGDSIAYLNGAYTLAPGIFRPSFYSLFMAPFDPFDNLALVSFVQHVLGLATGVLVYVLLIRLEVARWLAAVAALPVVFDGYQLNIEQFILAETLFSFLIVAALLIVVWRRPLPLALAAVAGLVLAMAATTRSVGLALIVPAAVYLLASPRGWLRAVVVAVTFSVAVAAYALWYESAHGTFALTGKSGHFLHARVAPFARCDGMEIRPYERPLCEKRRPEERPGPTFYMWGKGSPKKSVKPPEGMTTNDVLADFSARVIAHQPATYAGVVARDVIHYFAPGKPVWGPQKNLEEWRFRTAIDQARIDRAVLLPAIDVNVSLARFLRGYQNVVYTQGPVLALGLVLGLAGSIAGARGPRRRTLRAEALLFAASGAAVLIVPATTSMFDYRYLLPSLVLLPVAGAIGGQALWERVHALKGEEVQPEPTARVGRPQLAGSPEGRRS